MKVYINRQPVRGPYGGGNLFVKAFHKHVPDMGHEIVPPDSMNIAPDVILLAGLDDDGYGGVSVQQAIMYKMYQQRVKLVLRVNENDARKGTAHMDDTLLKIFPHMDAIVFVSHWLQDYFRDLGWQGENDCVIVNGVDAEVFAPQPKLNNGKVNIVAHHWSDNAMKGFDIYEKIDEFVGKNPDKYQFTYIGRDRGTFHHTNIVRPLSGKRLGEELGKHDVYVSASRFDPGPNHVVEAVSCGLPTFVHEKGGGCVEFAGDDHSFHDWDELKRILELPVILAGTGCTFTSNTTKFGPWNDCIEQYVKFLSSVVA